MYVTHTHAHDTHVLAYTTDSGCLGVCGRRRGGCVRGVFALVVRSLAQWRSD